VRLAIDTVQTDQRVIFIVVCTLVFTLVFSLLAGAAFAALRLDCPSIIGHAFDFASGAVSAILVNTRTRNNPQAMETSIYRVSSTPIDQSRLEEGASPPPNEPEA